MDNIKIIKASRKAVKTWREWHKDNSQFPSNGLIKAMYDLDQLFPGKKAGDHE